MRLSIELVPTTCWFSNVRSAATKIQWDKIRKQVANQACNICQICGGVGPKHPVECHEIWSYDDRNLIQKLEGMIALCPNCHQVKHFGFAQIQGKDKRALSHFMKINKLSQKKAEKYIKQAFELWAERSTKKWSLDISNLSKYGIDTSKIKERK